MKIGVVGSGLGGATAGYALVMRGVGREVVLVAKQEARAVAEADDIRHAVPFASPLAVRAGEYEDLGSTAWGRQPCVTFVQCRSSGNAWISPLNVGSVAFLLKGVAYGNLTAATNGLVR